MITNKTTTMKKILYIILFFLSISYTDASNLQDTIKIWMDEGNTAYQNKNYQSAIEYYLNIVDKNYEHEFLYYNLGNAYFKNEELGKAVLWYERALKLSPGNEDIQHNLAFVNQKLEDKIEIIPELFFTKWYRSISSSWTPKQWGILTIAAFIVLLTALLLFLFSRYNRIRSTSVYLVILSFIVFISSLVFAIQTTRNQEDQSEAIVLKSITNGKSTPNETGTDLFVIHEGLKVKITDQLNEWVEIKLPNGEKGWVEYSALEKI